MEIEAKYYTRAEIAKEYNELNHKERCSILYDALGWMEEYNGRSKFKCISMAMGYDNVEGEHNTFFKRPN